MGIKTVLFLWISSGTIVTLGSIILGLLKLLLFTEPASVTMELLPEFLTSLVFESLFFPIDLLVTWQINPLLLIPQIIIFVILLILRENRKDFTI